MKGLSKSKSIIAVFLAFAMILTLIPFTAVEVKADEVTPEVTVITNVDSLADAILAPIGDEFSSSNPHQYYFRKSAATVGSLVKTEGITVTGLGDVSYDVYTVDVKQKVDGLKYHPTETGGSNKNYWIGTGIPTGYADVTWNWMKDDILSVDFTKDDQMDNTYTVDGKTYDTRYFGLYDNESNSFKNQAERKMYYAAAYITAGTKETPTKYAVVIYKTDCTDVYCAANTESNLAGDYYNNSSKTLNINSMTVTYFDGSSKTETERVWKNGQTGNTLMLNQGDIVTKVDLVLSQPVRFTTDVASGETRTDNIVSVQINNPSVSQRVYGTFTIGKDTDTGLSNIISITPSGIVETGEDGAKDTEKSNYYYAHSYAGTSGQAVSSDSGKGIEFTLPADVLQIDGTEAGTSLLVGALSFGGGSDPIKPVIGVTGATAPAVKSVKVYTDKTTKDYGTVSGEEITVTGLEEGEKVSSIEVTFDKAVAYGGTNELKDKTSYASSNYVAADNKVYVGDGDATQYGTYAISADDPKVIVITPASGKETLSDSSLKLHLTSTGKPLVAQQTSHLQLSEQVGLTSNLGITLSVTGAAPTVTTTTLNPDTLNSTHKTAQSITESTPGALNQGENIKNIVLTFDKDISSVKNSSGFETTFKRTKNPKSIYNGSRGVFGTLAQNPGNRKQVLLTLSSSGKEKDSKGRDTDVDILGPTGTLEVTIPAGAITTTLDGVNEEITLKLTVAETNINTKFTVENTTAGTTRSNFQYGDKLKASIDRTANYNNIPVESAYIAWYQEGNDTPVQEAVQGDTSSYTLKSADIGKKIYAVVTSPTLSGSLASTYTSTVEKATLTFTLQSDSTKVTGVDKAYDGTKDAEIQYTGTMANEGMVGVISGDSITITSGTKITGSFDSVYASTSKGRTIIPTSGEMFDVTTATKIAGVDYSTGSHTPAEAKAAVLSAYKIVFADTTTATTPAKITADINPKAQMLSVNNTTLNLARGTTLSYQELCDMVKGAFGTVNFSLSANSGATYTKSAGYRIPNTEAASGKTDTLTISADGKNVGGDATLEYAATTSTVTLTINVTDLENQIITWNSVPAATVAFDPTENALEVNATTNASDSNVKITYSLDTGSSTYVSLNSETGKMTMLKATPDGIKVTVIATASGGTTYNTVTKKYSFEIVKASWLRPTENIVSTAPTTESGNGAISGFKAGVSYRVVSSATELANPSVSYGTGSTVSFAETETNRSISATAGNYYYIWYTVTDTDSYNFENAYISGRVPYYYNPIVSLKTDSSSINIDSGATKTVKISAIPKNKAARTTSQNLVWTVADTQVATITGTTVATGAPAGTAMNPDDTKAKGYNGNAFGTNNDSGTITLTAATLGANESSKQTVLQIKSTWTNPNDGKTETASTSIVINVTKSSTVNDETDYTNVMEDISASTNIEDVLNEVTHNNDMEAEPQIWIAGLESSYTYTGAAIKPVIRVYDGLTELTKSDYSVTYKNNKNVGTAASIIVKFKGNRSENITRTFSIVQAKLGEDVVAQNLSVGSAKKAKAVYPILTNTSTGNKVSFNKKEFSIAYYNEDGEVVTGISSAGEYTAIITGLGVSYDKESSTTATITVSDDKSLMIEKAKVTITNVSGKKSFPYIGTEYSADVDDKEAGHLNISVTLNKAELTAGEDYRVEYYNNTAPGKATVSIIGTGDFFGTKTQTFNISKGKDIGGSDITIEPINATVAYSAAGSKTGVNVYDTSADVILKEGVDYTLSYKNNKPKSVGTGGVSATIVVKGKGAYKGKNETASFLITQKELMDSEITVYGVNIFSNKALDATAAIKKAKVVASDNGKTMKLNRDYTIKGTPIYSADDKKVTVTIEGTGCYDGEREVDCYILGNDQNLSKAKVTKNAMALAKTYTGEAIELTENDFRGLVTLGGKTLVLNTDYEVLSYTNNNKKGTAKVTIIGLPGSTSVPCGGTKTISFKITAKGATSNYAGALIDGELKGGTKK